MAEEAPAAQAGASRGGMAMNDAPVRGGWMAGGAIVAVAAGAACGQFGGLGHLPGAAGVGLPEWVPPAVGMVDGSFGGSGEGGPGDERGCNCAPIADQLVGMWPTAHDFPDGIGTWEFPERAYGPPDCQDPCRCTQANSARQVGMGQNRIRFTEFNNISFNTANFEVAEISVFPNVRYQSGNGAVRVEVEDAAGNVIEAWTTASFSDAFCEFRFDEKAIIPINNLQTPAAINGLRVSVRRVNDGAPGFNDSNLIVNSVQITVSLRARNDDEDECPNANDNCPDDPNCNQADMDGDGVGDVCDIDADGDTVNRPPFGSDPNDSNRFICGDGDGDGCDDCSVQGMPNPAMDGPDLDMDGMCNTGDLDADGDGIRRPPFGNDPNDLNASICGDSDGDGCDDCSRSNFFDPNNDGPDFDMDGLCDTNDPDIDGDGRLNDADPDDFDPFVCGSTDGDSCDDCSVSGVVDPFNDGPDSDMDGICDVDDPINDCNQNLVEDAIDIMNGASQDCDGNGVPDECEFAANTSLWVNGAGGGFGNAANWCSVVPMDPDPRPGATGIARFWVDADYTVSLSGAASAGRAVVAAGDVTFDAASGSLTLNPAGAGAALVVSGGEGATARAVIQGGQVSPFGDVVVQDDSALGAQGVLVVDGPGASVFSNSEVVVGAAGAGRLEILGGASVLSFFSTVGDDNKTSATGSVVLEGPGSDWSVISTLNVQRGDVTVGAGSTLEAGTLTVFADGQLGGEGTVDAGEVVNRGRVVPGPDGLAITGNYRQLGDVFSDGVTGTLAMRFGGSISAPTLAPLAVTGSAALGGGLVVQATGELDPAVGARFDVMTSASRANDSRFGVAFLPGLTGDRFFRLVYDTPGAGAAGVAGVSLVVDVLGDDFMSRDPSEFGVGGLPSGATLADVVGGDGLPDLIVTLPDSTDPVANPGTVVILQNAGLSGGAWLGFIGGQITLPVGHDPTGVAAVDLDGANGLDLVVSNREDRTVTVLLSNGAGSFGAGPVVSVLISPETIDAGPIDDNGVPDIAVCGDNAMGDGRAVVLLNAGGVGGAWAGFRPPASAPVGDGPVGLVLGDVDGDGIADLATANRDDSTVTVLSNGGGSGVGWLGFDSSTDYAVSPAPRAIDGGDLDNDKDLDIVTGSTATGEISVLLNGGLGLFAPAVDIPGGDAVLSLTLGDLDSDAAGDLDIAAVVEDETTGRVVRVIRNDQDASGLVFSPAQDVATTAAPVIVLSGDVDGKSSDDLVVVNEQVSGGRGNGQNDVTVVLTGEACPADVDGSGAVDVFDILGFLGLFSALDPIADFNGDGSINIFDVLDFLSEWQAGCA